MKLKENKGMSLLILTIILAVLVVIAGGIIIYLLNNPAEKNYSNNSSPKDNNNNFSLTIQDIFTMNSGGVVVVGVVSKGEIYAGDTVKIIDSDTEILTTEIIGFEVFLQTENQIIQTNKIVEDQKAGIWLKDISKEQIAIGQKLVNIK